MPLRSSTEFVDHYMEYCIKISGFIKEGDTSVTAGAKVLIYRSLNHKQTDRHCGIPN